MSQEISLREESDDNGKCQNTASAPSLPLSGKRSRDKKESGNGPVKKKATGSAEFVVSLELANDVEISPSGKRRGVVRSIPSAKNDAAANCAQILKGVVEATEKNVGNEDSEQTNGDDDSTKKRSQKLSISKPPSNASPRRRHGSVWKERFSELADYRKIHGHCNVPQSYSESPKLVKWIDNQRCNYRLHLDGKTSPMNNTLRIQELESLGFEWKSACVTSWEDRLSELANYRKIHGHSSVLHNYSENLQLATWVSKQRTSYRLHLEGKTSPMNTFRIQELESLGFQWKRTNVTAWGDRLRELADFRKNHEHCNVPQSFSENTKLGRWIGTQRSHYGLHVKRKKSSMTLSRIQKLESLDFEWAPSINRREGGKLEAEARFIIKAGNGTIQPNA
jgi:hypothetical protein